MAVKILHTADFHMDSPFDALPEEKAVERRHEQRLLLEEIAELAEKEHVQLVLLSGDLFDSSASYFETQETLLRVFSRISAEIVISPGNHDYYCAKSPYCFLDFPKNVHIFKSPIIKHILIPELNCRVWGAGFVSPLCPPILTGFSADQTDAIDIMVIHGDISGGDYNHIAENDIASSNLDYLALGHIHSFSGIRKAGKTFYAYPGCPEGRGFDETGVKGVIIGTVDKGACSLNFTPLHGRQYNIFKLDMTDCDDAAQALLSSVPQGADRDVYRIILSGEYDKEINTDRLAEALKPYFYQVTVRNGTRIRHDIWSSLQEDSLKGLFIKRLKTLYDAADEEEKQKITLAVRYGLAALENREEWRP